ncbi:MAG TPA: hypothetical protein VGN05_09415 [Parvibaculum sp.]|jgi:hypothetical protein
MSARLAASAALLCGLALAAMSGQRALAYFYLRSAPGGTEGALKAGAPLSPEALSRARAAYLKALRVLPGAAELQQNLGRLELRRADAPGLTAEAREDILSDASDRFMRAIDAAPARAFPWSLAAFANAQLSAEPGQTASFLRYSYFLGPQEASSILLRARVALPLWDQLPDDIRADAARDLERLWLEPGLRALLAALYLDNGPSARAEIRRAILATQDDRQAFDKLLREVVASGERS